MTTPKCPICNSNDTVLLYTLSNDHLATEIALNFKTDNSAALKKELDDLFNQDAASFMKCKTCAYGFSHPHIAGSSTFYSLLYRDDFGYPANKWEFNATISALNSNSLDGKKVCEFGAGDGKFLQKLVKRGVRPSDVFSTEYSQYGVNAIRSQGFACEQKSVSEFSENFPNATKLDFVFMFQVLEHLTDVPDAFQKINSITKVNSQLFVSVPNEVHRAVLDKKGIHLDLPPIHVGKFHLQTFQTLAKNFGWKINHHLYEPMSFPAKVKKFLFFLYFQNSKGLKNESLPKSIRKNLRRYYIFLSLIWKHIDVIFQFRKKNQGTAFWISMQRIK